MSPWISIPIILFVFALVVTALTLAKKAAKKKVYYNTKVADIFESLDERQKDVVYRIIAEEASRQKILTWKEKK